MKRIVKIDLRILIEKLEEDGGDSISNDRVKQILSEIAGDGQPVKQVFRMRVRKKKRRTP